jgi:hypothetical protein
MTELFEVFTDMGDVNRASTASASPAFVVAINASAKGRQGWSVIA